MSQIDYAYSAAMLIKNTAKHTVYFRTHQRKVTPGMIAGNNYADKMCGHYKEMRSQYIFRDNEGNNYVIYFSFDEILFVDDEIHFVEYKHVDPNRPLEEWFMNMSVLQLSLYYSLYSQLEKKRYVTASFAIKEGSMMNAISLEGPQECEKAILVFGDKQYLVTVKDPSSIVDFYRRKAIACIDYQTAGRWDSQYYHREHDELSNFFSYEPYKRQ